MGDGNPEADLRPGVREGVERGERVAPHRIEVEHGGRVIERPEGFGTIGVERGEVRERDVREVARREAVFIQRAQKRERVEARPLEPRTQIRRRRRAMVPAASDHAATRTRRN